MKLYRIVLAAVLLTAAMLLSACGGKNDKTLHLFNYGDYLEEGLIEKFEKETGIKIKQDTFDTNEDMYEKVAGGAEYDLIIAADYTIEKMILNDMLQPVDLSHIPNSKYLDKDVMAKVAVPDPGNKYAVPYTWGTMGIMYNTKMIPEGSITSWKDLWKEEYKDGGIEMMNSVRDTFMVAEMILGIDMNTTNEQDLQRVVDLLMEQKPLVQAWKNDEARDDMVDENAAIAMIYSGEYLYCLENNEALAYCIPKEGSYIWFDCFVIPKNAKNVSAAEQFIDFMMRPESGVATFDYLGYPIPNTAAIAMLDKEYLEDENIFPPQEFLDKCGVFHYLGKEGDELLNTYWKKYKGN